ncbi:MAG: hypothetical protein LiPW41_522 [Parcubacteria group bacterium LiPW_41]|nr:MAG: hypothetical protein LiPW41_522 [Parcubacteria group bacterium LiPW_41]
MNKKDVAKNDDNTSLNDIHVRLSELEKEAAQLLQEYIQEKNKIENEI